MSLVESISPSISTVSSSDTAEVNRLSAFGDSTLRGPAVTVVPVLDWDDDRERKCKFKRCRPAYVTWIDENGESQMLGDPTLEGTRESNNQRLVNVDIYAPAYCTDPSIRIRLNLSVATPESKFDPIGPEQPELRFYSETISQHPRSLGKLGQEADLTYYDSDDLPKDEKVANHAQHLEHWSRRDLSCLEMKVNPSLANLTNNLSDLTSAQKISMEKLESLAKAERMLVYSEGSSCFENSMPYLQKVFGERGPSIGPCHHPDCAGFHPYNTTQLPDDLLEVLNNPVSEKSCFQCNEPGHKAHNCPRVKCHTFKEFGHM